jgi:hypothetical protein
VLPATLQIKVGNASLQGGRVRNKTVVDEIMPLDRWIIFPFNRKDHLDWLFSNGQ